MVSCVGAFGNNDDMRRINGDANIIAAREAKAHSVQGFSFISSAISTMPSWFLKGYYEGKASAESEVQKQFSTCGTILRPGFIYGNRQVVGSSYLCSIAAVLSAAPRC